MSEVSLCSAHFSLRCSTFCKYFSMLSTSLVLTFINRLERHGLFHGAVLLSPPKPSISPPAHSSFNAWHNRHTKVRLRGQGRALKVHQTVGAARGQVRLQNRTSSSDQDPDASQPEIEAYQWLESLGSIGDGTRSPS